MKPNDPIPTTQEVMTHRHFPALYWGKAVSLLAGLAVFVLTAAAPRLAQQPKQLWMLRHEHMVHAVAVSDDGGTVACAADTSIVIWSVPQAKQLFQLNVSPLVGQQVEYLPDGKTLLTYSCGRYSWEWETDKPCTLTWWDLTTRRKMRSIPFRPPGIFALSPDGKLLITGSGSPRDLSWKLCDPATGRSRGEINPLDTMRLSFSPDSKRLYTGHANGSLSAWDLHTKKEQQLLDRAPDSVLALAVCPDGKRVALCRGDSLFVISASTGKQLVERNQRSTCRIEWVSPAMIAACHYCVEIIHADTLQTHFTVWPHMHLGWPEAKGYPLRILAGRTKAADLITGLKGEVVGWTLKN